MSRLWLLLLVGVGAVAAALVIAVLLYRSGKLAILEPRSLKVPLVWSGNPDAACTLLMIGDSHVARWRTAPPAGWRTARLGFAGESAVNIAGAAPAAIAATSPDALLIAAGTNDASAAALQKSDRAATLDRAADAIDRMIVAAHVAGVKRIVVMTLVPPRFPELSRRVIYGDRQSATLESLSAKIAAKARARDAAVLDAHPLARDSQGRFRHELRADALHWSPAGYEILSAALWNRLDPCR